MPFGLVLAAGLTEGAKHIVDEKRPDLMDNHSFPFGTYSFGNTLVLRFSLVSSVIIHLG